MSQDLIHVMVDLETMGTNADAPLVAIGAVVFDSERLHMGETFYQPIDVTSSINGGAIVDGETIKSPLKGPLRVIIHSNERISDICSVFEKNNFEITDLVLKEIFYTERARIIPYNEVPF